MEFEEFLWYHWAIINNKADMKVSESNWPAKLVHVLQQYSTKSLPSYQPITRLISKT